jgi:hypothetical protein
VPTAAGEASPHGVGPRLSLRRQIRVSLERGRPFERGRRAGRPLGRRALRADTAIVGQLLHFPARAARRYDPAALDRLIREIDRRRLLRLAGSGEDRVRRIRGTVVPFRLADR